MIRRAFRSRLGRVARAAFFALLFLYLASQIFVARAATATSAWFPSNLPPRATSSSDRGLSMAVSGVAGRPAVVYCWSTAGWNRKIDEWNYPRLGRLTPWRAFTSPELPNVYLPPNICAELDWLRRSRVPVWQSRWVDALAWSLVGLAHESVHVSGIGDEAKAECYGMQRATALAAQLGRPPAEGRYLAWRYWADWYPGDKRPYRSSECRDGGRLDLHPHSNVWP